MTTGTLMLHKKLADLDRYQADNKALSNLPMIEKVIVYIFVKLARFFEKFILSYSLIGDAAYFKSDKIPSLKVLEESQNVSMILKECQPFLQDKVELPAFHEISPGQERISKDDLWKVFGFLCAYGKWNQDVEKNFPQTVALLKEIPGIKTAFFSYLQPGKQIPPHTGPFHGVVRAHLGLKIPTDARSCNIKVAGEQRHWEEGKLLIFDDRYIHEVHNNTNEPRLILFLDIERPLPSIIHWINSIFIYLFSLTSFVKKTHTNMSKWMNNNATLFNSSEREHKKTSHQADTQEERKSDVVMGFNNG